MSAYQPPGMIRFSEALARTAEMREPALWAKARPEERSFLIEDAGAAAFQATIWTRSDSVAGMAYAAIRPLLAEGLLPAVLGMKIGSPRPIEPESWQGGGADTVASVLRGTAQFLIANGSAATGPVFVRSADLYAVLQGEAVPSRATPPQSFPLAPTEVSSTKVGRRPNPEADRFWIEACRVVFAHDYKNGQAGFTEHMAQWSSDNMERPYDAETVRKKVGKLFAALRM